MRWCWVLAALALGCRGTDPELRDRRAALDAWRRGEALIDADPEAALAAFLQAREHLPEDPVLRTWEAAALARAGELTRARAALDAALALDPRLGEARYNRAAYALRQGDIDAALPDLQRAVEQRVRAPREIALDPDFAPYLDDPRFDFLPREPLIISVEAPDGLVFWGSEFSVRLRVLGALDGPLSVTAERFEGPVDLVRMVENVTPSTAGALRDLTYTFRVTGAGLVQLGPLHVWSGERRASLEQVRVTTAAPPGREVPEALSPLRDLATARELIGSRTPPDAWRVGDELRVLRGPGDRLNVRPAGPRAVWELREQDTTLRVVERFVIVGQEPVVAINERTLPIQ